MFLLLSRPFFVFFSELRRAEQQRELIDGYFHQFSLVDDLETSPEFDVTALEELTNHVSTYEQMAAKSDARLSTLRRSLADLAVSLEAAERNLGKASSAGPSASKAEDHGNVKQSTVTVLLNVGEGSSPIDLDVSFCTVFSAIRLSVLTRMT